MKIKMITSLILTAVLGLSACSDDRETAYASPDQQVSVSQTQFNIDPVEQTMTVNVTADREFAAYSHYDWLSVTPSNSTGNSATLTITAAENTETEARTGNVCVACGGTRVYVTVNQEGVVVEEPTITAPEGFSLVWNDEFSGDELGSDWTFEVQPAGWVNDEKQTYVKGDDVVEVSNGTLKIKLYKDGSEYKSGRIYAQRNTGWQYGYIEARIKLPAGTGTWPAFWMMPVNFNNDWPHSGEIDIMEHVGFNENYVHSTIHCTKYNNGGTAIETANRLVPTATSEFHTYAVDWDADRMIFYVDGEELLTYANDGTGKDAWPFDSPFYVILNLAYGGSWGGSWGVDDSCLPATLEVDYVRVFQK